MGIDKEPFSLQNFEANIPRNVSDAFDVLQEYFNLSISGNFNDGSFVFIHNILNIEQEINKNTGLKDRLRELQVTITHTITTSSLGGQSFNSIETTIKSTPDGLN